MQARPTILDSRASRALALLALAAAAVLCYLPVSEAELLAWDTQTYVIDNVAIHEINPDSLLWMLTRIYHANWHPLTWLSHAIDIQLFGFAAAGHHWVNVSWHIACAWMFYLLGQQLLPLLLPSRPQAGSTAVGMAAFGAALLFTVHPQHVESVAWVAERKDLLCAFFYLLCLYCYHRYIERPGIVRYLLSLVCAAAAIMSKPMAVTLPVVLLLFDLLLYRRIELRFWRSANRFVVIGEKIPVALLALISVYLTLQGQAGSGAVGSVDVVPIANRLATAIVNWVEYPLTTLLPLDLSPFYPHRAEIAWYEIVACGAAFTGLVLLAEIYRRRGLTWPMLALGYYTITLLPVIGIVQIGAIRAADRYAYLPTLPLYLLAAVLILRLLAIDTGRPKIGKRALPRLLLAALLPLALGQASFQYARVWQTDIGLWEFVREKEPDNIHAAIFLAEAYYADGDYRRALSSYRRAFANRALISPARRLNIFINRYADAAFRLGFYEEAEIALHSGIREQRLWFLPPGEVYFNAAMINYKLARHDKAIQLLEMAADGGVDGDRIRLLEAQIQNALNEQAPTADE